MVTRQSSPNFFLRYQALISPPGPPPTIARSSMCLPCGRRLPRNGTRGLTHPSKSAFHSEGKMNKKRFERECDKKAEKRPAFAGLFYNILKSARLYSAGGSAKGSTSGAAGT